MDIGEQDRNKYHTELANVLLEAMHIIENQRLGISKSHLSSTLKTFRRKGYYSRVGRIPVTIQSDNLLEDGDVSSLIVNPNGRDAELTRQELVRALIIDGYYRYEAIVELHTDSFPMLDWYRNLPTLNLNLRSDVHALSYMDFMS